MICCDGQRHATPKGCWLSGWIVTSSGNQLYHRKRVTHQLCSEDTFFKMLSYLQLPNSVSEVIINSLPASEYSHLHHVDEVVEVLCLVNCQLGLLVDDVVMKDLLLKAYAQDIVTLVPNGLAYQKQPILHWPQLADSLWTWDLSMEPSAKSTTRNEKRYIL